MSSILKEVVTRYTDANGGGDGVFYTAINRPVLIEPLAADPHVGLIDPP
jgi:hypothetical protein